MGEPLLFLLVAAAAVAVGLARGGALGQLRDHGVKAVWLAVGCLAVQATVVVLPMPGIGGVVLLVAALATLLGIARTNARLAGVPLLALGLILNLIVVLPTSACRSASRPLSGPGSGSSSRSPTAPTPSTCWSAAAPASGCSATGWPSGRCAPSPATGP